MAESIPAVASRKIAIPDLSTALNIALTVFALLSVLFLLQENGLVLASATAEYLHEVTHDARHALGVPCH